MAIEHGGEREALAPVIPLFHDRLFDAEAHETRGGAGALSDDEPVWRSPGTGVGSAEPALGVDADDAPPHAHAEAQLLRRLRTRSLSASEARSLLAGHGLDDTAVGAVIDRFTHLGYLDDAALAEQLVRTGVERKRQGRRTIAQTLASRGISREVGEAALGSVQDDDADRALAYARSKAASLARLEADVATRRLVGQLQRRGYGSGTAMAAALRALREMAQEH